MLMLYIRLRHRRRDESGNLPEDSSESQSRYQSQVNPDRLDLQNQVHLNRDRRSMYIQEVRSNHHLERRIFW
jgi:hypothetical protein